MSSWRIRTASAGASRSARKPISGKWTVKSAFVRGEAVGVVFPHFPTKKVLISRRPDTVAGCRRLVSARNVDCLAEPGVGQRLTAPHIFRIKHDEHRPTRDGPR